MRDRLEQQLKRTRHEFRRRELEALLELPPFPRPLDYLWRIFNRLRRRQGGGFGPAPIGFLELEAFQRLAGIRLAPWEIGLLEDLDDLYLATGNDAT